MHPSATKGAREPTGCVFVQGRLKQVCPDGLAVTGFWARNAPYFEKGQSPSCWTFIFTEGHVQRVPGYGGEDLQNDTKSKDKGKRPNQGSIAKRITPPEETRPTPLDHQARRRSRKETFFSQVAQNGRVLVQHEDNGGEDSQESPIAKTCSSYEKKPARIQKYQKNRDSF